jgi:hypothetical protein
VVSFRLFGGFFCFSWRSSGWFKAGILLFSAQNAWTICGEFVVLVMVFAGVKTTTPMIEVSSLRVA